jgi:hypothetical protein
MERVSMLRGRRARALVGLCLAVGLVGSMTGLAAADDITSDAVEPVVATSTVNVWVVSVDEDEPGDPAQNQCNIGNGSDNLSMTATVLSSDPAVATVSPGSLTFETCGANAAQAVTITCVSDGGATVTIALQSVDPNDNAVKGVFNTETITVACTGGGGGGTGVTTCTEPAAPAWAAALLKATPLKAKAKDLANHISQVAGHMTNGAVFDGVPKSDQGDGTGDEYPIAVRQYMIDELGLATLASVEAARALRPGWTCTTT